MTPYLQGSKEAAADGDGFSRLPCSRTLPHGLDAGGHSVPLDHLLGHFGVDPQRGLDAAAVQRLRALHGPNALPEAPPPAPWRSFLRQFKSPLIYILFVAAMLAVALAHHGDAVVILVWSWSTR